MGRKKACDVRVGTWLLLMELAGRAFRVVLPTLPVPVPTLPVPLARLPDRPRRNEP